jgi:hypothetical protein
MTLKLLLATLRYRHWISEVETVISIQPKLDSTGMERYDYHSDYKAGLSPFQAVKRAMLFAIIERVTGAPALEVGK